MVEDTSKVPFLRRRLSMCAFDEEAFNEVVLEHYSHISPEYRQLEQWVLAYQINTVLGKWVFLVIDENSQSMFFSGTIGELTEEVIDQLADPPVDIDVRKHFLKIQVEKWNRYDLH